MKLELLYPAWVILCAATGALLGNVNGYGTFRGLSDGVIVAMLPIFFLMIGLGIMSLWRPLLPPVVAGSAITKGTDMPVIRLRRDRQTNPMELSQMRTIVSVMQRALR
ncbi:MAG: hypothetical protein HZT41_05745 [Dechloromonas sp.]|nr:MAG: hypothetical protein HZT41_05745 [Dechloromonas sp.]